MFHEASKGKKKKGFRLGLKTAQRLCHHLCDKYSRLRLDALGLDTSYVAYHTVPTIQF